MYVRARAYVHVRGLGYTIAKSYRNLKTKAKTIKI